MDPRTALPSSALVATLAIGALASAGCGGRAAPVEDVAVGNRDAAAAAAPYSPLFTAGRSWTYRVEATVHDHDDAPVTRARSQVTCAVAEVATLVDVRLARIGCDGHLGGDLAPDPLTGVWARDDRGLWKLDAWPADHTAPVLDDAAMLLAATPAPLDEEHPDRHHEGYGERRAVEQDGDAWCVTSWWYGITHAGYQRWCFAAAGVIRGGSGWAGDERRVARFELAP